MGLLNWLFRSRNKAPENTGDVLQLTGDQLWSRAIEAANGGSPSEARRYFALAIRKNPWRYCGVGAGSLKPSKSHQQELWHVAMAEAGFDDLMLAVICIPSDPNAFTISKIVTAEREAEDILNRTCEKLGITKDGRTGLVAAKQMIDGEDLDGDRVRDLLSEGQVGLTLAANKFFRSCSHVGARRAVVHILAFMNELDGSGEYWKLANCLEALHILAPYGESAVGILKTPRYLKDDRDPIRRQTLRILSAMGPNARPALQEITDAVNDKDEEVSRLAKDIIAALLS